MTRTLHLAVAITYNHGSILPDDVAAAIDGMFADQGAETTVVAVSERTHDRLLEVADDEAP